MIDYDLVIHLPRSTSTPTSDLGPRSTDCSHVKSDEEALDLAAEIDELNDETGVYLGILYFLVEICRADEGFGEELSESRAL